jgi:hypothetical protein
MDSFFNGRIKQMKQKLASAADKYIPKEGIKNVANVIKAKAQEIREARAARNGAGQIDNDEASLEGQEFDPSDQ